MTQNRRFQIKYLFKRILKIVLPLFSLFFIAGTTAIILIIVNGYTIDITNQSLVRTGVLNIETNPADAEIFIDDLYNGNTNRAIPNISIGNYSLKITKNGYFDYREKVAIRHGLATIIIAPLIRDVGADLFTQIKDNEFISSTNDGFYVLKNNTDDPRKIFLTRFFVTHPIFDIPRPGTPETMTIEIPSSLTIKDIQFSPLGKNFLLSLQDKTERVRVYTLTFTADKSEKLLTSQQQLDSYANTIGSKLKWATNPDFVIIETLNQVISYNIKTGSRIILIEKQSTIDSLWSMTNQGIVFISTEDEKDSYSMHQMSFNGNSIQTPSMKKFFLPATPKAIWAESEGNKIATVVSTDQGSYLLGNMFENRNSEYEITSNNTLLSGIAIENHSIGGSSIKIADTGITDVSFFGSKFFVSFLSAKQTSFSLFIYNKRAAEHYIDLGSRILIKSDTVITPFQWLSNGGYFAYSQNDSLRLIDISGENNYSIQPGVKDPQFFFDDTTAIYQGNDRNLYFKSLR